MEHVKTVLQMLVLGLVVMSGMRVAEWLIPAPEMRVIVCMANDVEKIESCKILKDIISKHDNKDSK